MPVYNPAAVQTLEAGRPVAVWNNEIVALTASLAIGLNRHENLPNVLSVEVAFASNPGAFAVELQVADTNADSFFVTKATLDAGLNATFVGRVEATNIVAKFARLKLASITNSVAVTAKFF